MTFWALAAGVCLSAFFLALAFAQTIIVASSPRFIARPGSAAPKTAANCIFALRVLPFFLALLAGVGLVLPAFLKFEPRTTSEGFSPRLWMLSALGLAVLLALIFRCARILHRTWTMERQWRKNGQNVSPLLGRSGPPVYRVDEAASLLAVTGVIRPRIFVSRQLMELLTAGELAAALDHEMAHVTVFDNLKQWFLKTTQMPRWLSASGIDNAAWASVSEIAADDLALRQGASALDLASALIKVAKLKSRSVLAEGVAACHLVPELPASSLEARVTRLHAALEQPAAYLDGTTNVRRLWSVLLIVLPLILYGACVSLLLPLIHDALELLVR